MNKFRIGLTSAFCEQGIELIYFEYSVFIFIIFCSFVNEQGWL